MKFISGWYMSSTSNIAPEYRETMGHIEGLTGIRPVALDATKIWCLDNSVFTGRFEESKWLKTIGKLDKWRETCAFITIPDVVGDCAATLSQFCRYRNMVKDYPVALVSQDGIKKQASEIPWSEFDCLFVGGTDEHKLGDEGRWILEEAKMRGKWVHIGRVNSKKRILNFWEADSWDGTCLSFEPSRVKRFHNAVLEVREKKKGASHVQEIHFNSGDSVYSGYSGSVFGA